MSELNVDTIKKADGTGNLTVPAETGTVVTTASPSLGRRNLIINGAMQVAQRGTSFTTSSADYGADRFKGNLNSFGTWTVERVADAPANFEYSFKMSTSSAQTINATNDYVFPSYSVEGRDMSHLNMGSSDAQEFTISFWCKSNKTGTIGLETQTGTSYETTRDITINTANTWEYKTATIPANTQYATNTGGGTGLTIRWWLNAGSDFKGTPPETWSTDQSGRAGTLTADIGTSANDYFQLTGVQLEVGDTATPFEHRSYGEELLACSRYFQRWGGDDIYVPFATGFTSSSSRGDFQIHAKIPMRSKPTFAYNSVVVSDVLTYSIGVSAVTSPTNQSSVNGNYVYFTLNSSGATAYRPAFLLANNSTSGYISLDAEL